ncbi:MAG: cytochrome c, partial [Rhodospirillales bacterium]|nr:cytochrome c [Rhodospirillales bacterium]
MVLVFLPASMAAESLENIKIGKKIYTEQCVLCHGPAGEGWDWKKKAAKPPVPVPNLLEVLPERSDEYLATVIKFGGRAVGLTDFMPALGFNLTDRELRNLIIYLRELKLKPSANGAFFEKSAPPQPKNLVLSPRMGRTLS